MLFLRLDFLRLDMQNTVACGLVHCSLRLVHHLAIGILCDCSLLIADVTADFIIADPALALLFTTADTADSRFLFTSTSGFCSSQLDPDFYCSSSSSNLSPAFSEYHSCWSKLASS
ncbi:hypothetical protein F511_16924 [Dorcoceras hygrometricum]|uniref:Uncharacterized protein n=1 Tax=Dorcoceras hygrometricum TaxID=472368 RepID=A0A2Z7BX32_9LAMI|nr:hypothetical protein F511_16924 [Dorcoceras hygrometricum]